MINTSDLINNFDINYEYFKEYILHVAVFSFEEEFDKTECETIESGLRFLCENGNTDAVALYCFIYAYDNNDKIFSREFAINSFCKTEGISEKYKNLVKEVSEDVFSADDEDFFLRAPYSWVLNELSKKRMITYNS